MHHACFSGYRAIVALAAGCLLPGAASAQMLGPAPYVQFTDSPFAAVNFGGTFHLEDMEDGVLNAPGVSFDYGAVYGPGGLTDSVDADDGLIDGSGTNGRSFFSGGGSTGITFIFHADVLGQFPSHAGVVWTDGTNNIHFEAFDANGVSLGQLTGSHADGSYSGTTAEDRFYGAIQTAGGISRIHIWNDGGGIEVDHLQYGLGSGIELGDLNCDGVVDFDDINPFVLALSDPASYGVAYPDCNILSGDCDSDGDVDFDDINPFVALLSGQ